MYVELKFKENTISKIEPGEILEFKINSIKNPPTTEPTSAFTMTIENKSNFLIN
jgi:hypothetical protein